jgi:hypothetical protein
MIRTHHLNARGYCQRGIGALVILAVEARP